MKQNKKSFTLIEMLVVIAIIATLAAMLSGPVTKALQKAKISGHCTNNLKQIGTSLFQYELDFGTPQIKEDDTDTSGETAGKTAEKLMRLYVSNLADNLELFVCPVSNYSVAQDNKTDNADTVGKEKTNGCKYTTYNLTTKYKGMASGPANKIIIADVPFDTTGKASAHDSEAAKITNGPNCLFADSHVSNPKSVRPQGSSEYELDKADSSIYNSDKDDVKDTQIQRGADNS